MLPFWSCFLHSSNCMACHWKWNKWVNNLSADEQNTASSDNNWPMYKTLSNFFFSFFSLFTVFHWCHVMDFSQLMVSLFSLAIFSCSFVFPHNLQSQKMHSLWQLVIVKSLEPSSLLLQLTGNCMEVHCCLSSCEQWLSKTFGMISLEMPFTPLATSEAIRRLLFKHMSQRHCLKGTFLHVQIVFFMYQYTVDLDRTWNPSHSCSVT